MIYVLPGMNVTRSLPASALPNLAAPDEQHCNIGIWNLYSLTKVCITFKNIKFNFE